MALVQTGFSLIKTSDNSEVDFWYAHPDAPPARIFVEGVFDVHGAKEGDTFADDAYKLVSRWTDTQPLPAPWFSLDPAPAVFTDGKMVETLTLSGPIASVVVDVIKDECARRIYAIASDNAQKNMLANFVPGNLSAEDEAVFKAGTGWIMSMQATCRQLIGAADAAYREDSKWPAVPDGVAALAARF